MSDCRQYSTIEEGTTRGYKIIRVGRLLQDNGGRYKIVHDKSVLRYQTIQDTTERYKKVRVSTVTDDTRYYRTIQDSTRRYGTRRHKMVPNDTR
jgi:hypothetical protein